MFFARRRCLSWLKDGNIECQRQEFNRGSLRRIHKCNSSRGCGPFFRDLFRIRFFSRQSLMHHKEKRRARTKAESLQQDILSCQRADFVGTTKRLSLSHTIMLVSAGLATSVADASNGLQGGNNTISVDGYTADIPNQYESRQLIVS